MTDHNQNENNSDQTQGDLHSKTLWEHLNDTYNNDPDYREALDQRGFVLAIAGIGPDRTDFLRFWPSGQKEVAASDVIAHQVLVNILKNVLEDMEGKDPTAFLASHLFEESFNRAKRAAEAEQGMQQGSLQSMLRQMQEQMGMDPDDISSDPSKH